MIVALCIFALLLFFGWFCFSLAAGMIVFLSTLTTKHIHLSPPGIRKAETTSVMKAHTLDPIIMTPLNAAKERWYAMKERKEIERISIQSREKNLLTGYYWKSKNGGLIKTVVIVHGINDSAVGMAYLAEEYHKKEWNVLSVDLRSHGESEGKKTMGVRESEDLSIWVGYVEKYFQPENIFLHGVSMGAATVLLYAGNKKNKKSTVKGIIADSSYVAYAKVFTGFIRMIFNNSFVAHSIVWGASISCFIHTGVLFSNMKPGEALKKTKMPVLLFHGEKDQIVPLSMLEPLDLIKMKPLLELVVVPEAPHIGAYFYAPELYMKKIEEFTRRI